MALKQLVKSIVPKSVRVWRKHLIKTIRVNSHKKMSREEVEEWLQARYRKDIGAELHLDDPQRFTEKIQWCKLNAMDAEKSMLADKYAVRAWVAGRIGEQHLIPLLGVWDDPDDIDFSALPDSFVLKTNNASGTNIIVHDKSKLNVNKVRTRLRRWLDIEFGWLVFEPHYLPIRPRIIGEQLVSNADGSEAFDYKFHCFGGEPRYVRLDIDRHLESHSRVTFDMGWRIQDWAEGSYPKPACIPERPPCFDELVKMVGKLAEGFSYVRVDFYVIDDRPLFGEMTFCSGSGFEKIRPDEWDYKLGNMWDLSREPRVGFDDLGTDLNPAE